MRENSAGAGERRRSGAWPASRAQCLTNMSSIWNPRAPHLLTFWHIMTFWQEKRFFRKRSSPFPQFSLDRYFTARSLFSLVRSDREPGRGYSCSSREGYNVRNWKITAELANLSPRNVTRTVIIRSRIFLCFRLAQIPLLIFHIQPALAYFGRRLRYW